MIPILIALILLLIAVITEWIFGRYKSIGGGSESKIENSSPINIPQMQHLTNQLSINMSTDSSKKYGELFMTAYIGQLTPPIMDLDQIGNSIKYEPGTKIFRPSTHIGQRKLFLSEVRFLTEISRTAKCADKLNKITANMPPIITCVYAGAASNHTGLLSRLFPWVKFILVDPAVFDVFDPIEPPLHVVKPGRKTLDSSEATSAILEAVQSTNRICLINDIFTLDFAKACNQLIDHDTLYFISDIRTNIHEGKQDPDTADILWNLAQQYNWIKAIKPVISMLKFRHPFYEEPEDVFEDARKKSPCKEEFALAKENGLDFVENYNQNKLVYFDGAINLQAFAGSSSTETRLITDGLTLRDWGSEVTYENTLFYYNNIARCYQLHTNENAHKGLGFDHCNDCAIENKMWMDYIQRGLYPVDLSSSALKITVGPKTKDPYNQVQILVAALSKNTKRSLLRDNHGRFFDRYPLPKLIATVTEHNRDPGGVYLIFTDSQTRKHEGSKRRAHDRSPRQYNKK